jgi:hypothetical protein
MDMSSFERTLKKIYETDISSGTTAVNIDNIFKPGYLYLILGDSIFGSVDSSVKIRLRKDKATDTIADYQSTHQILQQNGGLAIQARNSSNTLHDTIYYQDNAGESASFEITLNAGSGAKYFTTSQSYGVGHTNVGYSLRVSGTLKLASNMYDGINFSPNTGTLEGGTIKIYEYEFNKDRFI